MNPRIRVTTIAIMVFSTALCLASIIQIFLICKPFAAHWDPQVLGSCGDQVTSFIVFESMGLILDVAILALPLILIMRLKMEMKRKVGITLIFNAGAV